MNEANTALSSVIPAPTAGLVLETRLRCFLDEMAECLERAHMASRVMSGIAMRMGCYYADLAVKPEVERFKVPSIAASFCGGPYAGLSVVANVLAVCRREGISRYCSEFAELSWHARDLCVGISPFADEMLHGPFQEAHMRLVGRLFREGRME